MSNKIKITPHNYHVWEYHPLLDAYPGTLIEKSIKYRNIGTVLKFLTSFTIIKCKLF